MMRTRCSGIGSAQLGNRDASFWLNLAGLFVRNGNDAAAQQRLHLPRNA